MTPAERLAKIERRAVMRLEGATQAPVDPQVYARDVLYLLDVVADLTAGLPEFHCPACGAVTRARMADQQ